MSRDLLLYKLSNIGIQGNFFSVLEDMYNKSTARLKINKYLSRALNICKGTEQGHPLSPHLFKIFILDLSEQFSVEGLYPKLIDSIVNHLFWADDLVLFGLDQASLQKNLDILHNFCETWGLEVNLKKTKVVCFGKKGLSRFKLAATPIKFADSYTYLGVTITKNGHVTVARNDLRKKALRALFALKKHANREYISPKSLLYLFDSLIKPILLYGSQVLLPHTPIFVKINQSDSHSNTNYFKIICQDKHELFFVKYLKWVLGVHKKASNVGVYGETGKLPLCFDGVKLSCDYFDRCKNSPDSSLVKKAFLEQKRLDLSWYHNITELLAKNSSGPHKLDSLNVFQNLRTRFIEKWTKYLKESPVL